MNRTHGFGIFIIGLLCVVGLLGCDQRPAVPTIAPEPTQPVVVIVVTATSQPTIAPTRTSEPSITPIPTLTPVIVGTRVVTITATPGAQATRPPATVAAVVQPTVAAQPTVEVPPTVAAPGSIAAPVLSGPAGKDFREVDTIKYEFTSVGPLAPDQCYRFDMTLGNPDGPGGVGDYWVAMCGDQSAAGTPLAFDLKPARFRDEANFGTLIISAEEMIPPTPRYVMQVFMSVVRIVDGTDAIHPTVEALSSNSVSLQSAFFK